MIGLKEINEFDDEMKKMLHKFNQLSDELETVQENIEIALEANDVNYDHLSQEQSYLFREIEKIKVFLKQNLSKEHYQNLVE